MDAEFVVAGATSGPGAGILLNLASQGRAVVGIGRDARAIQTLRSFLSKRGWPARLIRHDLSLDVSSLRIDVAVARAPVLINCTGAPTLANCLSVMPALQQIIQIGSTRVFSVHADPSREMIATLERTAHRCGIPATVLHPTLIYGDLKEDGVSRLARTIGRLPVLPLPDGGRALVQPVFIDDVIRAVFACLNTPLTAGKSLVIAGGEALAYRNFVAQIGQAAGSPTHIVGVPRALLALAGAIARAIPGLPNVNGAQVLRMTEDRSFDTADSRELLGFKPVSFVQGLSLCGDRDHTLTRLAALNLRVTPTWHPSGQ